MVSNKRIGRIVGVLFLLQLIIGILINQFLLGPIIFTSDFLTTVSSNATQVISSVLLGLIGSSISIAVAVLLLPIFKQLNTGVAFWYLGFSILGFAMGLIDNTNVLSILALSQEYVQAGTTEINSFEDIGTILYATRWWTHYLDMLVAIFALPVFYYVLYVLKLVPRFISVWGGIGVLLMLAAILFTIFDLGTHGTEMKLLVPLGLNRLFLAIWLMVKGFNSFQAPQKLI
ncbi:DUF4386 domain-containing protein [Aquimarina sp. 2304DJ70-9]|uniref:DUF4386 domain-containing protein n=1 Tax=Aquimarina penaris TaxID=3231044 RepID=UPI00346216AE